MVKHVQYKLETHDIHISEISKHENSENVSPQPIPWGTCIRVQCTCILCLHKHHSKSFKSNQNQSFFSPSMFHEYLLRDTVLTEVEDRRGAREELGYTPPDCPLPLERLRRTTVDVEDTGNGEFKLVKILTNQRPDCELTRSTALNYLREGGGGGGGSQSWAKQLQNFT